MEDGWGWFLPSLDAESPSELSMYLPSFPLRQFGVNFKCKMSLGLTPRVQGKKKKKKKIGQARVDVERWLNMNLLKGLEILDAVRALVCLSQLGIPYKTRDRR